MQEAVDDEGGGNQAVGGPDPVTVSTTSAPETDTRVPDTGSEPPVSPAPRCNPYLPGVKSVSRKGPLEATFSIDEFDTECPVCLKMVSPRASDLYKGHCCTQLYHAGCWSRSAWGQLRQDADETKNFLCPRCSIPAKSRTVEESIRQEMLEMLRATPGGSSSSDDDAEVSLGLPAPPAKLSAEEKERQAFFGSSDDGGGSSNGVPAGRWARAKMTLAGAGIRGTGAALTELRTGGKKVNLAWIRESGLKIDELLNQFTLRDLFDCGANKWKHLMEVGFRRNHLRVVANMGLVPQLVAYYHVDAQTIRRDLGMTIKDLAGLQLSATIMGQLGFNAHELCIMGLTKDHIKSFQGIPMGEWIHKLGLTPFHLLLLKFKNKDFRLGYLDYSWSPQAMAKMMNMNYSVAERLKITIAPRGRSQVRRRRRGPPFGRSHRARGRSRYTTRGGGRRRQFY